MKIKDILQLEIANTDSIILHKEGLFFRAYERSAYLFSENVKHYQLTKKFYKNVKQEIVYLGFPANVLEQILEIVKNKETENKEIQIIIGKYNFCEDDFTKWKQTVKLRQVVKTLPKVEQSNIQAKILNFSVISKTPIECQEFIIELQKELQTQ